MIDKEKVLTGLECCRMNGKGCRQCPYNKDCDEMPDYGNAQLCSDALELLREHPEQKFFVDSDGKMTPLPIQKHGHWIVSGEPPIMVKMCSECNIRIFHHSGGELEKFCAWCGAKMDKEVINDASKNS